MEVHEFVAKAVVYGFIGAGILAVIVAVVCLVGWYFFPSDKTSTTTGPR